MSNSTPQDPQGLRTPSFTVANLEPFYRGDGKPTVFDSNTTSDRIRRFSIQREDGLIHLRAYGTLDGVDLVLRPDDAKGIAASLERQLDHFQDPDTYHQYVNFTASGVPQGEVTAADYPTLADLESALGERKDLGETVNRTSLREATDRDAVLKALGIDPASVQFATIGDLEDDSLMPGEEDDEVETDDDATDALKYEMAGAGYGRGFEPTDTEVYEAGKVAGTQYLRRLEEAETPKTPEKTEHDTFMAGLHAGEAFAGFEKSKGITPSEPKNYLTITDPFDAGFEAGYMKATKGAFAVLSVRPPEPETDVVRPLVEPGMLPEYDALKAAGSLQPATTEPNDEDSVDKTISALRDQIDEMFAQARVAPNDELTDKQREVLAELQESAHVQLYAAHAINSYPDTFKLLLEKMVTDPVNFFEYNKARIIATLEGTDPFLNS